MPLPPHVLIGTERSRRGRFDGSRFIRWLHRPARRRHARDAQHRPRPARPRRGATQVDEGTRAFWAGQRDRQRHLAACRGAGRRARARSRAGRQQASRQPGIQRSPVRRADAREPVPPRLFAAQRGLPAQLGLARSVRRGAGSFDDAPAARRECQGGPLPAGVDRNIHAGQDVPRRRRARRGVRGRRPGPGGGIRRVVHLVPGGGRWRSICYPV